MQYIQSGSNPADKESRRLSGKDATLVKEKWVVVEDAFGPHSVDLMAVESNAMLDSNQNRLKYYSPFPMASAAGVRFFSGHFSGRQCICISPFLSCLSSDKISATIGNKGVHHSGTSPLSGTYVVAPFVVFGG